MNDFPEPAMTATAETVEPILAVNNIEVIYDHVVLVLKGVSLTVPRGGIVAVLGANGAGKTTTLKAISNLLKAERGDVTKGSIMFEGERVDRMSPADLVRRGCIQVMEGGTASGTSPSRKTFSLALSRGRMAARRSSATWRWSTIISRVSGSA